MFDFIESILKDVTRYFAKSSWWDYLSSTRVWNNALSDWLLALATAFAVLIGVRLFKRILLVRLRRWSARSETTVDDTFVDVLDTTRWYFYIGIALYAASHSLRLNRTVDEVRHALVLIVVFAQCGAWVHKLITKLLFRWAERQGARSSTTMAAGISFVVRLLVWVLVLLLVLSNIGVEISAVVAGLGVGGVAAALAVQSLLSDVFASLSMYFDRPFDIGDFVIVDDFLGTIQSIGIRTTRILSLGGEQIVFANSDLVKSRIRNYARMSERRIVFHFGIEYNQTAEKVARTSEIAREAIDEVENARFDRAHFLSFGDYSLNFEVVYYVLSMDYTVYMDCQHAINLALYQRFEEEGIRFAFPTRTVHVRSGDLANSASAGRPADISHRPEPGDGVRPS